MCPLFFQNAIFIDEKMNTLTFPITEWETSTSRMASCLDLMLLHCKIIITLQDFHSLSSLRTVPCLQIFSLKCPSSFH